MESDPTGLQGGINAYAYVLENPLMLVDTKGLKATCGGGDTCSNLTFELCQFQSGRYNDYCSDGLPRYRRCVYITVCPPFFWDTKIDRCPKHYGAPRA